MLDSGTSHASREVACPDGYPIDGAAATHSLASILRRRIVSEGPLSFAGFMAEALYHPEYGYYACGVRQVGRGGDFFTSVSVGPLFGELLARRFLREWSGSGEPARWRIIECGAHDGTLAADVLAALKHLSPAAFEALEYIIAEPLPPLRHAQAEKLHSFAERVRHFADIDELAADPLPGIAFGNEVLDALPCHLVEWRDGRWHERRVVLDEADGFIWQTAEISDPRLLAGLAPLGDVFPEGYRSEVRTGYHDFLAPLARALSSGLMLWLDYGFERAEYYHPGRREGTLRTFFRHRAGDDPLVSPGEADISAHVDFTAVAEAAQALGWQQAAMRNQGAWLTETARDWLLEMEGRPQAAALRQFQTLTHPAQLGGSFHALELRR
jgi:SAM-dependent MidA family methyltransferase